MFLCQPEISTVNESRQLEKARGYLSSARLEMQYVSMKINRMKHLLVYQNINNLFFIQKSLNLEKHLALITVAETICREKAAERRITNNYQGGLHM